MVLGDFNVPTDVLGHALTIGLEPAWLVQRAVTNANFTGVQPVITGVLQRPVVGPGNSLWDALTDGGLFTMQGCGKGITVEGSYSKNATFTFVIVTVTGGTRPVPATFPFKLGAGEKIKATTTGAAGLAEAGFMVRLSAEELQ